MYLLSSAVLLICSASSIAGTTFSVVEIPEKPKNNSSCESYQTPCTFGCCPFAEAVCCADGFECCQHGQTCIPIIGICLGLQDKNGKTSLVSSKSVPLKNSIVPCPAGSTTCGDEKCCFHPNAVCCSDGLHCCPHGYRCDIPHKRCIAVNEYELKDNWNFVNEQSVVPPQKVFKKSAYKSCPGGSKVCPSYTSCCIIDNGQWGCCPNPSLPQLRYGGGECCDTIFGHMCCPDDYPTCTVFGCTK